MRKKPEDMTDEEFQQRDTRIAARIMILGVIAFYVAFCAFS